METLLNTDFGELQNKTGAELTGYLKEKGITHDTKTEIFKMTDDFKARLDDSQSNRFKSELVNNRINNALTALYDAANIVDILNLEESKTPIEEKQEGMRNAVADLAVTSKAAKDNANKLTLEASTSANKQIDAQNRLDSLKRDLSDKEIGFNMLKKLNNKLMI